MKHQTHKRPDKESRAIRSFLDKNKDKLITYVKENGELHGMDEQVTEFVLRDIDNIFDYLYTQI